jgi:hypothetical protein
MAFKNIEDRKAYHRKWYQKNRKKRIGQIRKYSDARRIKLKKLFVEQLGGKCSICGYNKCFKALDFHHTEDNKEGTIAIMISQGNSLIKISKEVKKCVLLCANCHREKHYILEQIALGREL